MTGKTITAIALKVFSIYVIVSVAIAVPMLSAQYLSFYPLDAAVVVDKLTYFYVIIGATVVLGGVMAIILWKVSNSVLKTAESIPTESLALDHRELEKTFYRVLGLFFLVSSIGELPEIAAAFPFHSVNDEEQIYGNYSWLIGTIFELVVGLVLVFRTEFVAKVLSCNNS